MNNEDERDRIDIIEESGINKEFGLKESIIEDEFNICEDVSLMIKELPLSNPPTEALTLIYTNNSDSINYRYGRHFLIEKKLRGTWYTLPDIEGYGVHDDIFQLAPLACAEMEVDVSPFLENSFEGLYRIICKLQNARDGNDKIVICEFGIFDE